MNKIKAYYFSWKANKQPIMVVAFGKSAKEIRKLLNLKSGYYKLTNKRSINQTKP